MREILTKNMRRIGLDAYEVGGCIRDELLGKEAKDIDFAVVGLSFDELYERLRPFGRVEPNIVGGGHIAGIRAITVDGEKVFPLNPRQSYGELAETLQGKLEPVVEGDGRLVGCRLINNWTPAGGVEISLARTEKSTSPGRANFDVEVDSGLNIFDDLGRRDFTVNAIARNIHTGELIDPFNGRADVSSKTLRVIGPESFAEDPSRILRGLVRVAKDNFRPDLNTFAQMQLHAEKLAVEPAEQIFLEFERLLAGNYAADALRIGAATGALQVALPELAPIVGFKQESRYHDLTCDEHTFRVVEEACRYAGASQTVRWAALFHDVGKPVMAWRGSDGNLHFYRNPDNPESRNHEEVGAKITRATFDRLKQPPEDFREDVIQLVAEHMYTDDRKIHPLRARRFVQRIGRDRVDDLLLLRRCDRFGKSTTGLIDPDEYASLQAWEKLVDQQRDQPLLISDLVVSGHDAMSFNFKGREIGELFRDLVRLVTDDPDLNTRERLLAIMARRAVKQGKLDEIEAEEMCKAIAACRKER